MHVTTFSKAIVGDSDEMEDTHGTPDENYIYGLFTYGRIFSDRFINEELADCQKTPLAPLTGIDKSPERGWNHPAIASALRCNVPYFFQSQDYCSLY